MGEVSSHFIGANGFHVNADNEDLQLRDTLNLLSETRLFLSFNQSYNLYLLVVVFLSLFATELSQSTRQHKQIIELHSLIGT